MMFNFTSPEFTAYRLQASVPACERVIKRVKTFLSAAQKVSGTITGFINFPFSLKCQIHLFCSHTRVDKKHGFFECVIVRKVKKINAGRHLCICVHINSLKIVDMNMLSAFSDQRRQPHWSEIVQTVPGSFLPATVRPAPFTYVFFNVSSLKIKDILSPENSVTSLSIVTSHQRGSHV